VISGSGEADALAHAGSGMEPSESRGAYLRRLRLWRSARWRCATRHAPGQAHSSSRSARTAPDKIVPAVRRRRIDALEAKSRTVVARARQCHVEQPVALLRLALASAAFASCTARVARPLDRPHEGRGRAGRRCPSSSLKEAARQRPDRVEAGVGQDTIGASRPWRRARS